MSAFVMCNEALSVIAQAMTRPDYHNRELGEYIGCAPELPPASAAYIFWALGEFNADRVNVRYTESEKFSGRYVHDLPKVNDYQIIKFCECYLYQCSEGDDCEMHVVFQAVERLLRHYLERVVHAYPLYEAAGWGYIPEDANAGSILGIKRPNISVLW